MNFVFINGRGSSGKDTQADRLVASNPRAVRISTGDIFRDSQKPQNEQFGRFHDRIQPYVASVNAGGYIPDEVILPIVNEVISDYIEEGKNTFIFTGFPRTEPQLRAVDAYVDSLKESGKEVGVQYVCFAVLEEHSIKRAEARRMQAERDGTNIRVDDDPAIVERRLATYKNLTEPMLKALVSEGRLHIVKSRGSIEQVEARLKQSLDSGPRRRSKER